MRYRAMFVVKKQSPVHREYDVQTTTDLLNQLLIDRADYPEDAVLSVVPLHEDFAKYIAS